MSIQKLKLQFHAVRVIIMQVIIILSKGELTCHTYIKQKELVPQKSKLN